MGVKPAAPPSLESEIDDTLAEAVSALTTARERLRDAPVRDRAAALLLFDRVAAQADKVARKARRRN